MSNPKKKRLRHAASSLQKPASGKLTFGKPASGKPTSSEPVRRADRPAERRSLQKKAAQTRSLQTALSSKTESGRLAALKEEARSLPLSPGVYLMRSVQTAKAGADSKPLYIGKAKALRLRVLSYFTGASKSLKNRFLLSQTGRIDYIATQNEVEAFLLEASLIKKHRPRYNIRLKDDKAYPYIRCRPQDPYPRFYFERKAQDRKSLYFGPYTAGASVREVLDFVNKTFHIRDCSDSDFKTRKRPCLSHQIGRCDAPCVRLVSRERYQEKFQEALRFLRGSRKGLKKKLQGKMEAAAGRLRFEEAARARACLKALEMLDQNQTMITKSRKDTDAAAVTGDDRGLLIEMLHSRAGRVIGNRRWFFPGERLSEETIVSFLNQYYEENPAPDEILTDFRLKPSAVQLMNRAFSKRKGGACQILPLSKRAPALLKTAQKNAELHFQKEAEKTVFQEKALREIQRRFHLPRPPRRMECYDISHWGGKQTTGAQVVFENGRPLKTDYRLYNLRAARSGDDFAALQEVLERRLAKTECEAPDLILIDGGKGQLRAAGRALEKMKTNFPLVSLAKDRMQNETLTQAARSENKSRRQSKRLQDAESQSAEARGANSGGGLSGGKAAAREAAATGRGGSASRKRAHNPAAGKPGGGRSISSGERFYLPGRKNPVPFPFSSPAFRILLHLRDEAHRFALQAHRKRRNKAFLKAPAGNKPAMTMGGGLFETGKLPKTIV